MTLSITAENFNDKNPVSYLVSIKNIWTQKKMKVYVFCFILACLNAVNSQPTSASVWDALDAKVEAVDISDFYFLLGDANNGVFYTYQKGKRRIQFVFKL